MLLHESRRAARTTSAGDLVLLDQQDRALWDRELIAEGCALVERTLTSRRFGPYTLQAAIAAVHSEAASSAETDWGEIVGLYDILLRADPSPVAELNRAAALAMRDGPAAGLVVVEELLARGELDNYHLAHPRVRSCVAARARCRCQRLLRARLSRGRNRAAPERRLGEIRAHGRPLADRRAGSATPPDSVSDIVAASHHTDVASPGVARKRTNRRMSCGEIHDARQETSTQALAEGDIFSAARTSTTRTRPQGRAGSCSSTATGS